VGATAVWALAGGWAIASIALAALAMRGFSVLPAASWLR